MKKTVFVSIVGIPNVGKSSVLNRLIGEKLSIVTDKPQTTRTRITGVLTQGEDQYVFIDTPGIHRSRTELGTQMNKAVRSSLSEIDAVLFVMDATAKIGQTEQNLIRSFGVNSPKVILLLNKIDLLAKKEQLMQKIAQVSTLYDFAAIIPISAQTGDNFERVLPEISRFLAPSQHFFAQDQITDQHEKMLAAELIREQLLLQMSQEIPHGIAVVIEEMTEREDKDILDISAVIYCEKKSHKGMIIGKNGQMLKEIASAARVGLEDFFQIKVALQCWVKVKENWRNNENQIRNFGLQSQ